MEEQPLQSLIGKLHYLGQSGANLIKENIYFYQHSYTVPKHDGGFGTLEIIASPSLSSIEWPAPDRLSITLMKSKMLADIRGSMKYTKPTHSVGISWICPLHIFVAIFDGFTLLKTPTMFVCKKVEAENMVCLFGEQWSTVEGEHNNDIFMCNVIESTISFRYVKARMTLYIRFSYERWMKKNNSWIPLQAEKRPVLPLHISITLPSDTVEIVSATTHWSLFNVREHLNIIGAEDVSNAMFKIKEKKIRLRMEPKIFVDASWEIEGLSMVY